jgi:hypothetical protein
VTLLSQNDKAIELTHSGSRALTLVQERPNITLSQVSEALSWTVEKTAYILNILEQKRLIRSEYVTERTRNGQERKRRLFPVGSQKVKPSRSPQKSKPKSSAKIEGILTYIRKEGYEPKVEHAKGGEYLIRLRPRRVKGSRAGSSRNMPKASTGTTKTGYQEGSRAVRPKRRKNKS